MLAMEDREMMGGFGMGFGGILWIAIIALIVFLVWQYLKQDKNLGGSKNSPLEILKQRYARGEVDKEEYEEKKRDLIE
ncbi:MAG: SHOCT domain-containing protein [Desulfatiglandales bacterium]